MLTQIRAYSGSLVVKVLFLFLVLSFVLWGVADVFAPGRGGRAWVAKVGDVTITADAFAQSFDRTTRSVAEALGQPLDRSQAQALGLVDSVLNQMISQALLDQGAADLGLAAGDDVVRAQITADPRFQTAAGQFDAETFRRTLRANGLTEAGYVELLRGDIVRRQLVGAVTAVAAVPKPMLELIAAYEGERRIGRLALIAEADTPPPPPPDEATLAQYHAENAARFSAPEYRAVSVVAVRLDELAARIAIGEDELRAAFADRADEFATPERRSFRQLVLPDQATAQRAYARLAEGAPLARVAAEIGGDAGGEPAAIEVARGDLPAALAEALFALAPGAVAAPVESPLGWHVMVLDKVHAAAGADFAAVRDRLAAELARDRATDQLVDLGNRLDDVLGRGASLEDAAAELGLAVRRIEALTVDGRDRDGRPVADLLPDLAATAFATAQGGHSLLTEAGDQGYFVVRVDAVVPAALKPLAEVREGVAAAWRGDTLTRLTRERAERLADAARGGRPLAEVAREAGLVLTPTRPLTRRDGGSGDQVPPDFVTALFAARPGDVFVVAAPGGQMLGVLERIEPAPATEAADPRLARRLQGELQNDLLVQYLEALRRRHPVSVNAEALARLF